MRSIVVALSVVSSACNLLVGFEHPAESGAQCTDGVDNDGNGRQDCDEATCAVECSAFTCAAGVVADSRGFDPASGHCYLGFAAALDIFSANEACMAIGGYLAVPNGAIEDGLLRSAAPPSASLGLVAKPESDFQFRLVTGDIGAEYLNFTAGQPDEPRDQLVCVSYDGAAATWQDNACSSPRPYVCELHLQPCGDFVRQPGEECDDGNQVSADGCDASCVDVNECTLGADNCSPDADCINQPWTPHDPGFVCQCQNGFIGDGVTCTPLPPSPVFEARGPSPISGLVTGCTTTTSHRGRKIALDPFGALYAVMLCSGDTRVAVSVDAGATWSAPALLGSGVEEAAVVGVSPGRAVVAMQLSSGEVDVRQTMDFGMSWGPSHLVAPVAALGAGISLATDGNAVLVASVTSAGRLRVDRSQDLALTSFTGIDTVMVAFGDVLVNPQNPGEVWAVGDSPLLHLMASTDGGVSFPTPEATPSGEQPFSDWAIGGGSIFVTGASDQVNVIPIGAPGTSTLVSGLPAAASGERTLAADPAGTLIVAQAGPTGGVQVVRLASGASVFDAAVNVDAMGASPGITVVPNGLVAVVYTGVGQIHVAIVAP